MSRRVAGAAAAIALIAGLTACGGGSDAGDTPTLTFWMYQPRTPQAGQIYEDLRKGFEKANNVKVKYVQIAKDDYNTKLSSAIASGTAPDAGVLDQPLVSRFALDKTIVAVPDGTIEESAYYKGALDTNLSEGKLFGLPLDQTTVGLFYNKKLVPTPPKTWDELKATVNQIHQADSKIAGIVVPKGDGYGAWMWPGFVAGAGGALTDDANKKVLFDQQPAVDTLQMWVDLLPSSPRQITDSDNAFANGLAAMMISGPWDVSTIKDQFPDLDFNVAPLPYKTEPAGNIGGENGVVFSTSKNAALAWKFLQYITSDANNAKFADAFGGYPTNVKAAEQTAATIEPQQAAFLEQLKVAHARPAVPQWIQVNDEIIAPALEKALSGKATAQQALTEAADKTRSLLGWNS
ncbi:sugar ABC transporter substrate-binding protein [Planotetraspora phitsanulokensis]|uniref:ABC transporter substrate-binding protein n=1 Tax=Planotetraspora phitsanulokensis TaxID=575192 RepID=A0A8J3XD61_9ACTN|nr:ABC transporter substrate-binding protein [Planotetraspora phitsanulokensis]GII36154.1 ABC transporter substrate-binding protein [Planotetraspora phitsanulokensis]